MGDDRAKGNGVSKGGKIRFGIVLPTTVLVAWQVVLIESTRGHGGWAGMGLALRSFVLVPGLLIANF